jgi:hypothetical protein
MFQQQINLETAKRSNPIAERCYITQDIGVERIKYESWYLYVPIQWWNFSQQRIAAASSEGIRNTLNQKDGTNIENLWLSEQSYEWTAYAYWYHMAHRMKSFQVYEYSCQTYQCATTSYLVQYTRIAPPEHESKAFIFCTAIEPQYWHFKNLKDTLAHTKETEYELLHEISVAETLLWMWMSETRIVE